MVRCVWPKKAGSDATGTFLTTPGYALVNVAEEGQYTAAKGQSWFNQYQVPTCMTGSRSAMFVCTKYTKVMSPEKEETRYCSSSMTIGHAVFIMRAHMWWCDGPLVLFSSIFWLKNSRRKPNRVIQCLAPNTFPKQVITFPQKSDYSPSIREVCQKKALLVGMISVLKISHFIGQILQHDFWIGNYSPWNFSENSSVLLRYTSGI